jgi:hypothetical protein
MLPGGRIAGVTTVFPGAMHAFSEGWVLMVSQLSLPRSSSSHQSLAAAVLSASIGCLVWSAVEAKTLLVGSDQELKLPSAAAAVARADDKIIIDPGEYFDCAIWNANGLTIEGKGDGVIMTDRACAGKGLFVIEGNDITIRNITFTRARVPDGNGAGIRAEGVNLRIEHCRFVNNENGILSNPSPKSTIVIIDSEFSRNGKCEPSCAHGIYIAESALLHVERSKFTETKTAHDIKSRALRTELVGNEITDGEAGTSSYLVELPNGGSLVMTNNVLQKGRNSSNPATAVSIGAEGVTHRTAELTISGNKFANDQDRETVFVRNLTATEAVLTGNTFKGKVVPLVGDGSVR